MIEVYKSNGGGRGCAIKCCSPKLAKKRLAWLVLMRAPKKRTIRMKSKEARLVKSLDAGEKRR